MHNRSGADDGAAGTEGPEPRRPEIAAHFSLKIAGFENIEPALLFLEILLAA
jgi:hypothetical protein